MTQEPVLWVMPDGKTVDKWGLQFYGGQTGKPLYAQPLSDKPYGYVRKDGGGMFVYGEHQFQNNLGRELVPVYLHPQREWVGLTDEEIDQGLLRSDYALQNAHAWRAGVVFAMTQLKEKNNV